MKSSTLQRRRSRYARLIDSLEPRTLMSVTVSSYTPPNLLTFSGAYDSSGNLWVTNFNNPTLTLDEVVNGAVVDSISIDGSQPNAVATGLNGHIWIADGNGGLDDVDTINHTFTPHIFASIFTNSADVPQKLTVTPSGDVWFIGFGTPIINTTNISNRIGRYDPSTDTTSFLTLDSSTDDSSASSIAADGSDGVWVGMAANDQPVYGTNHLAKLSFSGSISATYFAVHTLNSVPDAATADAFNPIGGVASDGAGGVWFLLSNSGSTNAAQGADRLVHGVLSGGNLNQTATLIPGGSATTPLTSNYLTGDGHGKLWFNELTGTQGGVFDTSSNSFTMFDYPSGVTAVGPIAVNPAGTQASFVSLDDSATIVQIDVDQAVTFSGTATNLSGQERSTFNSVLLATFVAPPPATGTYSASLAWGDSTTTVVPATYLGDNTYAVVISGKSFASQGTYNGVITIKDSANVVAGILNFQSVISDIPLTVTSFNTIPLILRIVTATATFTDDPGRAASSFTASINWGDNTTSNGIIVQDPTHAGRYLVLALHQYSRKGTYTARITVTTTEVNALINVNSLTSVVHV